MIASVHIADLSVGRALASIARPPRPRSIPGLRHANLAIAAPLSESVMPAPQVRRLGLVAFWDDDAALDRFVASNSFAARFADGWHARLDPIRMHGSWPGMPEDTPNTRTVDHDGPAVVLTLGRLRLSQARRFVRTSAKAEAAAVVAPGFIWGTGLAKPPFVATCSVWESSTALATYAYGHREPAHSEAIATDQATPFHRQSAFIRFRPTMTSGSLGHRNPFRGLTE